MSLTYSPRLREKVILHMFKYKFITFDTQKYIKNHNVFYKLMNNLYHTKPDKIIRIEQDKKDKRKKIYKLTFFNGIIYANILEGLYETEKRTHLER